MHLDRYQISEPVCSGCGHPCYFHGYNGYWVFPCFCPKGTNKPIEKHVYNQDWSREDD